MGFEDRMVEEDVAAAGNSALRNPEALLQRPVDLVRARTLGDVSPRFPHVPFAGATVTSAPETVLRNAGKAIGKDSSIVVAYATLLCVWNERCLCPFNYTVVDGCAAFPLAAGPRSGREGGTYTALPAGRKGGSSSSIKDNEGDRAAAVADLRLVGFHVVGAGLSSRGNTHPYQCADEEIADHAAPAGAGPRAHSRSRPRVPPIAKLDLPYSWTKSLVPMFSGNRTEMSSPR
jgi:hypothetical protein